MKYLYLFLLSLIPSIIILTFIYLTDKEKELFEKYNSAKAVKDFQLADQYRQQLIDKNLM